MSLILDALNRADSEREEAKPTGTIPSPHSQTTPATSHRKRWVIEGVLIAAIIVVAVLYVNRADESPAVAETPAAEMATLASPVQPAQVAKPIVPVKLVETKPVKNKPATVKPAAKPKIINTNQQAINSLYQQAATQPVTTTTPQAVELKPAAVTTSPTTTAKPVDETNAVLQSIPLLAQMSTRFQRSIPTIEYTVHVYSENRGSGLVKLNGESYKIGGQVLPGLRVIAILKDSLVLEYQGRQFRLMALNSWVRF